MDRKEKKAATKELVKPKPSLEYKSDVKSESDSELLHQCYVLMQNVKQHVKRRKKVRGSCEEVTDHQHELQQTDRMLNELERPLIEQISEQQCT